VSLNVVTLLYLLASICFIQALKGLSHPTTSIRGNVFGMVGMAIAAFTTAALIVKLLDAYRLSVPVGLGWIVLGLVVGGGYGAWRARTVQMTQMPELVAFFHSMIGLAAVFIAVAAAIEPYAFAIVARPAAGGAVDPIPTGNRLELILGAAIGAITFSGSVIAWGKLSGKSKVRVFQGAPVTFAGQHWLNLVLAIAMVALIVGYTLTESRAHFVLVLALAFLLGVLIIIPIGGADMPVVVSMLNSYSGWAAAGIGFSLNNAMLIIAGSLVGSSGAILSYIMCRAMNRSFISVIAGGFGGDTAGGAAAAATDRPWKRGSAEDAAFLMQQAEQVIIVPGYGMAVAQAQHVLREMADKLKEHGVRVKYAIHPVAGRMPGHMNVLLAEANVPYDEVFELEDINSEFAQTDVAFVIGANDVTNPAAKTDKSSPIYGMPVLDVEKAKTVLFVKRSMGGVGYAGVDNDVFYMDNTMMLLADAKKMVEEIVKSLG
jgi:NAD(P) transhydrogenase subunit beta